MQPHRVCFINPQTIPGIPYLQGALKDELQSTSTRAAEARQTRVAATSRHDEAEGASQKLRSQIQASKVSQILMHESDAVPPYTNAKVMAIPCFDPTSPYKLAVLVQGQHAKSRLREASKEVAVTLDSILASCTRSKLTAAKARQQVRPNSCAAMQARGSV